MVISLPHDQALILRDTLIDQLQDDEKRLREMKANAEDDLDFKEIAYYESVMAVLLSVVEQIPAE